MCLLFLLALLSALQVRAQDASAANPAADSRVRVGAAGNQVIINEINTQNYPRVRIFATVLENGALKKGLTARDFRVREDEVDQEPLTVEPQLPPLSVVITLDTSGSMKKRLVQAQAAAVQFLGLLGAGDSAQVISFARQVTVQTPMSSSREAAETAIQATTARGDTALYDALYESIRLAGARPGRRAVVLLSDGVDDDGTGRPLSKRTVPEVLALARQVNVPVYCVGLGSELDEAVLTEIAARSGAQYFNAPEPTELASLYSRIGEQLSGQYAISYTSNLPADGTPHRVQLKAGEALGIKEYLAPGGRDKIDLEVPAGGDVVIDKSGSVKIGEDVKVDGEGVTMGGLTVKTPGLEPMKEVAQLPESELAANVRVSAGAPETSTIPKWVILYPGAKPDFDGATANDEGTLSGTLRYDLPGQEKDAVTHWFGENYRANKFTVTENTRKTQGSITAKRESDDGYTYTVMINVQPGKDEGAVKVTERFVRTATD